MSIANIDFARTITAAQEYYPETGYLVPLDCLETLGRASISLTDEGSKEMVALEGKIAMNDIFPKTSDNQALYLGLYKDVKTGKVFSCFNRAPVAHQRAALEKKGVDLNDVFAL